MKNIIFLHHSTGYNIWLGNTNKYVSKITGKGDISKCVDRYNRKNSTEYHITEQFFPKSSPYGWNNYPFDYYNIWVKNAGNEPYMDEPTLELLTKEYEIIVFKHCFPVSKISEDTGLPDINSKEKRLENYKLQYDALKTKMKSFPNTKFIVWTPAVYTMEVMTEEEALRTQQFHDWIINDWDESGDNIFVWDFYSYETEGGLYLSEKYATAPGNSHPNKDFSAKMAPILCRFIIDVAENRVQ
jgi:hypothetical protein